jgi:succinate-semialdehyde dehydrogenase / glutarate-semialdehyde dehydrogenase
MAIQSINPATGATLRVFDPLSAVELEQKLARAAATFQSYRRTSFAQRAEWLLRAAEILDRRRRLRPHHDHWRWARR